MTRPRRTAAVPAVCLLVSLPLAGQDAAPRPPVAAVRPHAFDFHGTRLTDPYAWLKDKKSPAVVQYLDAENAYREAVTKRLQPFADALYAEMLSHVKQTDLGVPVRDNGYWYYHRTEEGKSYRVFCRRKGSMDAPEEVLLDVNALAAGHKFFSAEPAGVSDDGRLYAYLTDTSGYREYHLSVKDLGTGKLVEDKLAVVRGVAWAPDNRTLFYVTEDAAKRPYRLYRHTLGEPRGKDVLVYEETDTLFTLIIDRTRDKKYLIAMSESSDTSEQRVLAADTPAGAFRVLAPRRAGVEYAADHRDGVFHIGTNAGGAVNFKWVTCPVANTDPVAWAEFEPYRPAVYTTGVDVFRDFAVVSEREGGVPQLRVVHFDRKAGNRVPFAEPSYYAALGPNPEFAADAVLYYYTSLVTPLSVYACDAATRAVRLVKRTEIPGGFDPANYVTERIEATAPDGVKAPVSLVSRLGTPLDGTAPLLLYGYGSYGAPSDPSFRANVLPLLDRGGVFAIAHVRGSSDLGRQWYLDGKLLKKKNTFTDFIACADHLVARRYTRRDRLAIEGASAGGLLIGAVLNRRPDLCKAALLGVPFLDVINTMLDDSIPLTAQEYLEWGDPRKPAEGRYMLGYSPYDNLKKAAYPAILVTTSLNDSQVPFHEPAKYVAKLRTLKTDTNPLLLRCDMHAGHGGASGRYEALRERAGDLAFLLDQIGLKP